MGSKIDVIILAGGRGSRLQPVVQDVPKPLADIAGRPFLDYLIGSLRADSIGRVILSTGYKSEEIEKRLARWQKFELRVCVEEEPLGTGGAIQKSLEMADGDSVLVLNGDTYFEFDHPGLVERHRATGADISVSVTLMKEFDRYGCVAFENDRITGFEEKRYVKEGYINAGVYVVNRAALLGLGLAGRYSFEKDVLEAHTGDLRLVPFVCPGYFIDIGIPEDYRRAGAELPARVSIDL